jgi:Zn-dependent membrane protease YugP
MFDWTYLLLIPAMALAAYAQAKVSSSYNKYSQVRVQSGMTGAHVARMLLDRNGLMYVTVEQVEGTLSDHYDPTARAVRLSEGIYNVPSVAAVSVAAHETGHAVQHANEYMPLKLRSAFVPIARIGSGAAPILIALGLGLDAGASLGLSWLVTLGIFLFAGAVLFQVVTLPVEFNASNRAMAFMKEEGVIAGNEEISMSRKMLNAAALTYVGAALTAVLQLFRYIIQARRR